MTVVLPGGSGQVGPLLARPLTAQGHDVVVLSRSPSEGLHPACGTLPWRQVARHVTATFEAFHGGVPDPDDPEALERERETLENES